MREFKLFRNQGKPLSFIGDVVAHASTKAAFKPRWTELTLYITKKGSFISHSSGVTTLKKEMNIVEAEVFSELEAALEFFKNKEGEFTWVSNQILLQAQEKFPELHNSFSEKIE